MSVLVYGSGQLAKMMYLAAAPLGVDVQAVDVSSGLVVNPVSKLPLDISVASAITHADALTVEFEHVPENMLAAADKTNKLFPNIESILAGADRVREKSLLKKHNIPNCEYVVIHDVNQIDAAIERLGDRIVFKASRDGYDGYGQWRLTAPEQKTELLSQFAQLDLVNVPIIAERMVDFERELSIVGVRDKKGNIKTYSLAENLHFEGQLHVSISPPKNVSEDVIKQAGSIFEKIAKALDYVGVLAVELFQCGEILLVNEIAPRVHNSGHWTMQGANTSQFEQHIRAISGLPLGSTNNSGVSAMVNVIGCSKFSRDLLSIPRCHLHWYGKKVRSKRKMGHINLVADSYQELSGKLKALSEYLPMQHFPLLLAESKRLGEGIE